MCPRRLISPLTPCYTSLMLGFRKSLRPGFSLSELMISIGLLSVGLLTVLGLFLTMASQTDSDGTRIQVSHLLESYQGDLRAQTEAQWIAQLGSPIQSTQTLDGRDVEVETSITRLSTNIHSPDYHVYSISSVAEWDRKQTAVSDGKTKARLTYVSHVSPSARY